MSDRLWAALLLAATLLQCSTAADDGGAPAGAAPAAHAAGTSANEKVSGAVFPPRTGYLLEDYRGRQVDLRLYQGKIVLLNFWATWCPPCRYEIPDLVRLRDAYSERDVAILGVSVDRGSPQRVRPLLARFVDQYGINYPVLLDNELRLLRQLVRRDLTATGVPLTFVIDRKGRLFSLHEGLPLGRNGQPDPGGVLEGEIRQLLGKK